MDAIWKAHATIYGIYQVTRLQLLLVLSVQKKNVKKTFHNLSILQEKAEGWPSNTCFHFTNLVWYIFKSNWFTHTYCYMCNIIFNLCALTSITEVLKMAPHKERDYLSLQASWFIQQKQDLSQQSRIKLLMQKNYATFPFFIPILLLFCLLPSSTSSSLAFEISFL